jgi:hypothetical protein
MTQEQELIAIGEDNLKKMQELVTESTLPLIYPTWVELSQKEDGGLSFVFGDSDEKPSNLIGDVLLKGNFVPQPPSSTNSTSIPLKD